MTTATLTSEAKRMADRLSKMPNDGNPGFPTIGMPAPSSVSHQHYAVGYYADKSILVWSINDGFLVLDEEQTYYRDTVEHLARCLGLFTKERRAEMVGIADKWIEGIHWSSAGEFVGM
jgi:hypothetical protein